MYNDLENAQTYQLPPNQSSKKRSSPSAAGCKSFVSSTGGFSYTKNYLDAQALALAPTVESPSKRMRVVHAAIANAPSGMTAVKLVTATVVDCSIEQARKARDTRAFVTKQLGTLQQPTEHPRSNKEAPATDVLLKPTDILFTVQAQRRGCAPVANHLTATQPIKVPFPRQQHPVALELMGFPRERHRYPLAPPPSQKVGQPLNPAQLASPMTSAQTRKDTPTPAVNHVTTMQETAADQLTARVPHLSRKTSVAPAAIHPLVSVGQVTSFPRQRHQYPSAPPPPQRRAGQTLSKTQVTNPLTSTQSRRDVPAKNHVTARQATVGNNLTARVPQPSRKNSVAANRLYVTQTERVPQRSQQCQFAPPAPHRAGQPLIRTQLAYPLIAAQARRNAPIQVRAAAPSSPITTINSGKIVRPPGNKALWTKKDNRRMHMGSFDRYCKRLEEFKDEYGDCDVPYRRGMYRAQNDKYLDLEKYHGLGQFVHMMRKQLKLFEIDPHSSMLYKDEQQKLSQIGFCMSPLRGVGKGGKPVNLEPIWDEEMYLEYKLYIEETGRTDVPIRGKKTPLREWLEQVHSAYNDLNEGRSATITDDEIHLLTELGIRWGWKRRRTFDDWSKAWLQWKKENPDEVAKGLPKDKKLGEWMRQTRVKYDEWIKDGSENAKGITRVQIDRLNNLGFIWERKNKRRIPPMPNKSFDERIQELIEYKDKFGDTLVPQFYPGLGHWVNSQRTAFKKWKTRGKDSSMNEERYAKLLDVGFTFDSQKVGPRFKRNSDDPLQTQNLLQNAPTGFKSFYKWGARGEATKENDEANEDAESEHDESGIIDEDV